MQAKKISKVDLLQKICDINIEKTSAENEIFKLLNLDGLTITFEYIINFHKSILTECEDTLAELHDSLRICVESNSNEALITEKLFNKLFS